MDFSNIAGQLVAGGTRNNTPVVALEQGIDETVLQNLEKINGLLPKLTRVIIHETRIHGNPLGKYFKKSSLPFGVGIENFQFEKGATNKKSEGKCFPFGNVQGKPQIDLINFSWNLNIDVGDREINKGVFNEIEKGNYVTQKLRTLNKTLEMMNQKSQIQLISDVIDGTRSISSTTQSDGQGTSVTYNPTIKGYCGNVFKSDIVLPELATGMIPEFASADDAINFVKTLENTASEMREESTYFSALDIETFVLDKPLLIAETKTLNAIDNSLKMSGNYKGIPTKTGREFMERFAEIVEIPKFVDLPTNNSYTNYRIGAVLIDRDSLSETIAYDSLEATRCVGERKTCWNTQGEKIFSVYRGNPAYALLTKTQA